jgi:hypothetical protein
MAGGLDHLERCRYALDAASDHRVAPRDFFPALGSDAPSVLNTPAGFFGLLATLLTNNSAKRFCFVS